MPREKAWLKWNSGNTIPTLPGANVATGHEASYTTGDRIITTESAHWFSPNPNRIAQYMPHTEVKVELRCAACKRWCGIQYTRIERNNTSGQLGEDEGFQCRWNLACRIEKATRVEGSMALSASTERVPDIINRNKPHNIDDNL